MLDIYEPKGTKNIQPAGDRDGIIVIVLDCNKGLHGLTIRQR